MYDVYSFHKSQRMQPKTHTNRFEETEAEAGSQPGGLFAALLR